MHSMLPTKPPSRKSRSRRSSLTIIRFTKAGRKRPAFFVSIEGAVTLSWRGGEAADDLLRLVRHFDDVAVTKPYRWGRGAVAAINNQLALLACNWIGASEFDAGKIRRGEK